MGIIPLTKAERKQLSAFEWFLKIMLLIRKIGALWCFLVGGYIMLWSNQYDIASCYLILSVILGSDQ